MKKIDYFLNTITMYRLTLYYLIGLIIAAMLLSAVKILPYSFYDIAINAITATIFCYISNYFFSKIFRAVTNTESVFITALILVLIIPVKFPVNITFLIVASVVAMASKYLLTIEKKHIFNPAAVSVAGISMLSAEHTATWWIGTPAMLPFVIIGGLLLIKKIQRDYVVLVFLILYFFVTGVFSVLHSGLITSVFSTWQNSILNSALLFFTFVMLTEPLTTPQTHKLQGFYSGFTALLYATPQIRFLSLSFTPEIALCLGNVFSYIINPNYRLVLPLKEIQKLSSDIYAFVFSNEKKFKFIPGQYMEWTLPHAGVDNRGNRRYFSLASSPREKDIMITVRFYNPSSTYKRALLDLKPGQKIIASQLAGDFTLPNKNDSSVVFMAGGVGIAPFRSMVQDILDKNLKANITLIYANRRVEDIVFTETFEKARKNGINTVYVLTDVASVPKNWSGRTGYINERVIAEEIPDYKRRVFYISGPQLMVQNFEKILENLGIQKINIRTDFFPGYIEQ